MPVLNIRIDHPQAAGLEAAGIRKAVSAALEAAGSEYDVEATLIITGESELQRLNRDYRGNDEPTDVLSFPDGSPNPENGLIYLGDVAIAYPVAAAHARDMGYRESDEIELLVIHGFLHLLGYDHHNEEERTKMWAIQKQALSVIGSPIDGRDWE
jgi:probable rRNA maturation factor